MLCGNGSHQNSPISQGFSLQEAPFFSDPNNADVHANNSMVVLLDEDDKVMYEKHLPAAELRAPGRQLRVLELALALL